MEMLKYIENDEYSIHKKKKMIPNIEIWHTMYVQRTCISILNSAHFILLSSSIFSKIDRKFENFNIKCHMCSIQNHDQITVSDGRFCFFNTFVIFSR